MIRHTTTPATSATGSSSANAFVGGKVGFNPMIKHTCPAKNAPNPNTNRRGFGSIKNTSPASEKTNPAKNQRVCHTSCGSSVKLSVRAITPTIVAGLKIYSRVLFERATAYQSAAASAKTSVRIIITPCSQFPRSRSILFPFLLPRPYLTRVG